MRLTRLLVLALLVSTVFSACNQGNPRPGATIGPDASNGTPHPFPTQTDTPVPSPTPLPTIGVDPASLRGLNLQIWDAFAGSASDLFIRQAAQFSAANEWGITVKPTGFGDYTGLFEAVSTALDSGQAPDLAVALPEEILSWNARGVVTDLRPYLGDPKWGLAADTLGDIPSIFRTQDEVNGQQLGLPAQRSARFLFYNQTWAHELGFTNPPASTQDFRLQACAANASLRTDKDPGNDAKGGWVVDPSWQTTYSWLLAFGGSAVNGSGYAFHTDPNLAALQFIRGLSDAYCAWPSQTPYDSFASRTALFLSGDLSELSALQEAMQRLKNSDSWTVIPFPASPKGVLVVYGPSFTVLKSTPEKQLAAWLFIRWMLAPENQSQWVEATGLLPLRNSELAMIQPYRQAFPQWDAAVGYLSDAQGVPQLASWGKVRYVLEDGVKEIFQNNLTLDKLPLVLDEMDALAEELSK